VIVSELAQQLGFVAGFEVDGVDEQQFAVLLARIVAALEQIEAEQLLVADAQALNSLRAVLRRDGPGAASVR